MTAGKARTTEDPARRVSFSELLGGMVEGSRLRIRCLDLDRSASPCLVFPLAMRNAERIKLSGKEEGA